MVATVSGYFVIKYADKSNVQTEQEVLPSRSWGIRNEIGILSSLDMKSIPRLHAAEEAEEYIYAVTRFIPGSTLDQYGGTRSLLPGILLTFITQVAMLHQQGVVHGDITPNNVVVSGQDVFLIDFELAHHHAISGVYPGLYHYLSPEAASCVLRGEAPRLDVAEETFALASTCLAVLTGRLPMVYSTSQVTRMQALTETAERTRLYTTEGCHRSHQKLARNLRSILELPSTRRPTSPRELSDMLKGLL